eukprot:8858938-Pyramimonas_sp.AAC.1
MVTMGFASSELVCWFLPSVWILMPVPCEPARTGSADGLEQVDDPREEPDVALPLSSSARVYALSIM